MNCRTRERAAVLFGDIFDKIRNIRLLEQNGFRYVKSNNGSHQKYRNDKTKRTVSVPVHAKELKKGIEQRLLKDAGLI